MPTLSDIFNNRPFRTVELTAMVHLHDVVPTVLGDMGEALFPTTRSRNRTISIYKQKTGWRMVPVSPIGAPPVELKKFPGEMRPFTTRRLAKGSTILAEELQGVLAMPLFDAVVSMQQEVATRTGMIVNDMEITHEHMRLGAIQGKVIDADGTTVLDDWFQNWGVVPNTTYNFKLNQPIAGIRATCLSITDAMWYASQGAWIPGRSEVHALCGADFFVKLVTHPEIEKLYLNYVGAQEAAGKQIQDTFVFGGITFHRYRGTPNGDFQIAPDAAAFFPMGTGAGEDPGAFQRVMGPGEFMEYVNQPGPEMISMVLWDKDRGSWMRPECYNYPLYLCLRPEMLNTGVAF